MTGGSLVVGVFGAAGAIGSAVTAAVCTRPYVERVVIHDVDHSATQALAMDLAVRSPWMRTSAIATCALDELAEADVIVCCAGVAHRDGTARADMLLPNARIVELLTDALRTRGWAGDLLIVTNPVDPLVHQASRALRGSRVLGYTLNDTSRLRAATAVALGVPGGNVVTWSLGEHGPHSVPILSDVCVDGQPVKLDDRVTHQVLNDVRTWYSRWQQLGTGTTTHWASAHGVVQLIDAVAGDQPVRTVLSLIVDGPYGIWDSAVSVLVELDRDRTRVVELTLSQAELNDLRRAAAISRQHVAALHRPSRADAT